MSLKSMKVLGIDLAGVPHRATGMCFLEGFKAKTFLCYQDDEILDCCQRSDPELVTVDAPLHLPPGRKTIDDRNGQHYRPCDLELRKRKIPFFPITLGPMRTLTERGIRLKRRFENAGFHVMEMYPGGAQDVWGLPRAKKSLEGLRDGLCRLGLRGLRKDISDHELDAATGALVGRLYLQGRAVVLGDLSTGAIILPRSEK